MLKTILLVDDEPELCEILADDFSNIGVKVVSALDGDSAKKVFCADQFDLVISDINMPYANGIELLKYIREGTHFPETPFYFTTGFAELSLDEAKSLGALGILEKPIFADKIREQFRRDRG